MKPEKFRLLCYGAVIVALILAAGRACSPRAPIDDAIRETKEAWRTNRVTNTEPGEVGP